jgi:hypothetical protein
MVNRANRKWCAKCRSLRPFLGSEKCGVCGGTLILKLTPFSKSKGAGRRKTSYKSSPR